MLTFPPKMLTTIVLNDDHDHLVDILFFHVNNVNVLTSSNIYVGVNNIHSWSIIMPYLGPKRFQAIASKPN